jgi:hypothetical protein
MAQVRGVLRRCVAENVNGEIRCAIPPYGLIILLEV